jgi:hypothetical protein
MVTPRIVETGSRFSNRKISTKAFVSFRFASVAITNVYTLRYPSQNEGRGCGGGGIQYGEWTESLAYSVL